jgi:carboxyl-terminal processing protease
LNSQSHHRPVIQTARWLGPSVLLFSVLLLGLSAGQIRAQETPVVSGTPALVIAPTDAQKRQQSFTIVWTTVKQFFYDPTFNGLDWDAVRRRYEPLVAKASSDAQVHQLLQQMLNELHQSHFLIIPPEAIPRVPDESADEDAKDDATDKTEKRDPAKLLLKGNYELAQKLTTGIGIDLRIINGLVVVTRVQPGSTAARAGVRPGFVIKKANGKSLENIISETLQSPLYHAIIRSELPLILVAGYINGPPETSVRLLFLDGQNRPHTIAIKRERLKGEMSAPVGNLPAMYGEIESRRLANGIGYIRFNAFVPALMEKLCHAIRSLSDAPGIILDLRGNQGGLLGMLGGLSGLLQQDSLALGFMETRGGRNPIYAFPQKLPYSGSLAIVIDGSTESAAEMFAGGMQETKRAVVVGETSAGNTLPSTIRELPTGALFQYAFANYRTPGGTLLEGHGVLPDLQVKLSRRALLTGHDPQLEAAIGKLRRDRSVAGKFRPGRTELIADVTVTSITKPPPTVAPQEKVSIAGPVEPPPPPKPLPENKPAATDEHKDTGLLNDLPRGLPTSSQIIAKYIEAVGGRVALEKVHSRVSRAQTEITGAGTKGSAELYEKGPTRFALLINVPGLGVMMRGSDGQTAWWQDPLQGYIEFPQGTSLDAIRGAFVDQPTSLKEMSPVLRLTGVERLGPREVYVLQGPAPSLKLYFDAQTGLLLRKGNIYYEDYREVDGVKLPFSIREDSLLGFTFVYKITDVKHNVPIDEAKFAPYPSCFTNPER